jgi:hypothetical protein
MDPPCDWLSEGRVALLLLQGFTVASTGWTGSTALHAPFPSIFPHFSL